MDALHTTNLHYVQSFCHSIPCFLIRVIENQGKEIVTIIFAQLMCSLQNLFCDSLCHVFLVLRLLQGNDFQTYNPFQYMLSFCKQASIFFTTICG